jgi:hypothetical protein
MDCATPYANPPQSIIQNMQGVERVSELPSSQGIVQRP